MIPGLGRSPGEGKGYPLQYSSLENSTDCIVHGVTESRTQLSDFHFHPACGIRRKDRAYLPKLSHLASNSVLIYPLLHPQLPQSTADESAAIFLDLTDSESGIRPGLARRFPCTCCCQVKARSHTQLEAAASGQLH